MKCFVHEAQAIHTFFAKSNGENLQVKYFAGEIYPDLLYLMIAGQWHSMAHMVQYWSHTLKMKGVSHHCVVETAGSLEIYFLHHCCVRLKW